MIKASMLSVTVLLAVAFAGSRIDAVAEPAFDRWVQNFRDEAKSRGISDKVLDEAFNSIVLDESVLKAANNQAEFTRAIWDYLDRAVSDWRIREGVKARANLENELIKIERETGVDRSILVAIWGLESSYGGILNNDKIVKNVVRSLATLAYGDPQRRKFGRTQLLAALEILASGDISPQKMTGSWAGAMGHTQFIPTTYLSHAIDYDGDGKRDIWQNELDALASAANYLAKSGWEKGRRWGYEVSLPDMFDYSLADRRTVKALNDWQALGVKRIKGRFSYSGDDAKLFLPAGARGPAFLLLKNFDVIKRYNNADAYALAIGHLSDRIKGFGSIEGVWPRDLLPLNREERETLQRLLTEAGFDTKGVDGIIGPNSRKAIRLFQASLGLLADGFPTKELLLRLSQN